MERRRIVQAPILEDFVYKFHNVRNLYEPGVPSTDVGPRTPLTSHVRNSVEEHETETTCFRSQRIAGPVRRNYLQNIRRHN